jgi:hypothetical protein
MMQVPFATDAAAAAAALSAPPYFGAELEVSPVVPAARYLRLAQRRRGDGTPGKVCAESLWAWDAEGPFGSWDDVNAAAAAADGGDDDGGGGGGSGDGGSEEDGGRSGSYAARRHVTLAAMLGVNGIWGWGSGAFSHTQGGFVDGKPTLEWGPHRCGRGCGAGAVRVRCGCGCVRLGACALWLGAADE